MNERWAEARALDARAYITGLRLEPECLKEWHPYLDILADKAGLPRRRFYRLALWLCAQEDREAERLIRADRGYRNFGPCGLHNFLRVTGFLSEFGRARRSWFLVEKITNKILRRENSRRRFHNGASVWTDLRNGIMGKGMSRGIARLDEDDPAALRHGREVVQDVEGAFAVDEGPRSYARNLIRDWRKGLCGGPPIRKLPDRADGQHVRWNDERRLDLRTIERQRRLRERRVAGE